MNRSTDLATAERRFFNSVGLTPVVRRVQLRRLGCSVRVHEAGDGPAIVFVHGAVTSGVSWADLAARLPDFRCIMFDRPGCGLSDPLPRFSDMLAARQEIADDLLIDVLDAVDLDVAHVVSNSLGGWFSFRSAAAHPDRIGRVVGMGFQVGARITDAPWFMRLQTPPWLAGRIPLSKKMVRRMLSAAGMRSAIESGHFTDQMIDVMVALLAETDTMRNDMSTAPRPISLRGPIEATVHTPELLARVSAPTHLFWGTDDPFGGEAVAREFAASLPSATLQIVDGAGHAPWIDQLESAADAVRTHFDR